MCFSFAKVGKLNLKFSISNLEMAFKLNYIVNEPLDFIFTGKIVSLYDTLFKFYLRFIIFQFIFSKIYSVFKNQRKIGHFEFLKATKILNKSFSLLKSFQSFLFIEVKLKFITNIDNRKNLD